MKTRTPFFTVRITTLSTNESYSNVFETKRKAANFAKWMAARLGTRCAVQMYEAGVNPVAF